MSPLHADEWRALSPYLDQALDMSVEERAVWLESIRAQNPALATDLQLLLKEYQALGDEGFLEDGVPMLAGPQTGQTLGAYTMESPIGRGGMGTVWVARRSDGRFQGRAAVKLLNVALLGGAAEERFKREGSFLARLAHPNIAHLIDAGVSVTGQPYLVLEYVEGHPIDGYCNQHRLDIGARIQLFLEVLAAVAHAHANLIVHRDIKPSNVLVSDDGRVKLLDFGIAKLLEGEAPAAMATVLTREGERALTLAYAAPEQVAGSPVTTATDVYALGVLLYLLLAGKHPAESVLHSPADLIKAIVETEPARPSAVVTSKNKLSRALRGDLDTIVAKALKKDPAERYLSVAAFADDLRRYLRDEPITARPDTLVYRAKKFVLRNRVAVGLAAAALVAAVTGVVGTVIQARTARIERDFALRQLSRSEAINDLNSFVLSDAAPSGKPFTVDDLLARAEELVERQHGPNDANRVELLLSIGSQYLGYSEFTKARRVLEEAYTLARALPDRSTRARTSCALAGALSHEQASTDRIREQHEENLIQEGLSELPGDALFALDRVFCLQWASEVAVKRSRFLEGIDRLKGAQLALSQSPYRSEVLELDILVKIARLYPHVGKVREASATFEEASARLSALGRDKTRRVGTLFTNWGMALWLWGQPLAAERMLRRAIELGQDDRTEGLVSPMLLLNYADVLRDLGRPEEALDYAERAAAKARKGGDWMGVQQSLLSRTGVYVSQGNFERAEQTLSELQPTLRDLPAGHITFAWVAADRARIAAGRGDGKTALDLVNQAVATAEAAVKARRASSRDVQVLLVRRSDIELQLGRPDEAAEDARRALKILQDKTQPGAFSRMLGRTYLTLGRALEAQGKGEEARSAFASALQNLESVVGPDHAETRAARQLAQRDTKVR